MAVDVAIHAPHREGDQRNHHAHVLTTARQLEPEGFTDKTRVLDAAKTCGVEIEQMRGVWAELQNRALERAGEYERVDHRSLEKQRETALDRGDQVRAVELDRDPELKLGPAANSMERREKAAAERDGRDYVSVTERGAVVHAARQAREAFRDMRERLDVAREVARETYGAERDAGQGRVSAGLAALRAAAAKDRSSDRETGDIRERLSRVLGRDGSDRDAADRDGMAICVERDDRSGPNQAQERLRAALGRDRGGEVERDGREAGPSIRERLEIEEERDTGREQERDKDDRDIHREVDRDRGLSH